MGTSVATTKTWLSGIITTTGVLVLDIIFDGVVPIASGLLDFVVGVLLIAIPMWTQHYWMGFNGYYLPVHL